MSLVPFLRSDDFFAPFFSGFPFDERSLMPSAAGTSTQQLTTRSMPVDVVEVSLPCSVELRL
jgi:hypothetical protein